MLRPLALLLAILPLSSAAEEAWPPEITAIVDQARSLCEGGFSAAPEAVTQRDLYGDGTADWAVDSSAFSCADSFTLYCGSRGCSVDGVRAGLILHGWDTLTEGGTTYLTFPRGDGETARFLRTGKKWQLQ